MNITAVMVTYADRHNYVRQVIDRLLTFNLYGIIIVNNNSVKESSEALASYAENNNFIKLINLNRNTGSAYAFKCGIEKALEDIESEFIWLFDDDCMPEHSACEILKQKWTDLISDEKSSKLILASIRSDRQNYIDAVRNNDPQSILGENNIFRSFHVKKIFAFKKKRKEEKKFTHGNISCVPYGGMFFHKDLIEEIGFPDDNYFLYCDDFDFCCRHVNNGGRIVLSTESVIHDIEKSWNVQGRAIRYIAQGESFFRIYYSIRNRVFLEKKYLVTSWPVYILNMLIYSSIVTVLALGKFKFNNIKTYFTALYHGLTGKMGYNKKYRL